MTYLQVRLFTLFFILPFICHSQAQTYSPTPLALSDANSYYASQHLANPLFNGRIHRGFSPAIQNTGFLDSNGWQRGNVVYERKFFSDQPLRFDALSQSLVVKNEAGFPIALYSERVDSFTMGNHYFIRLENKLPAFMPVGFYERLNEGKAVIYCFRKKVYYEAIQGRELYRAYIPAYKYYILMNGTFTPVQSRGKLMSFLGGNKSAFKRALREKNLTWNNNMEESIQTIVAIYNQQP